MRSPALLLAVQPRRPAHWLNRDCELGGGRHHARSRRPQRVDPAQQRACGARCANKNQTSYGPCSNLFEKRATGHILCFQQQMRFGRSISRAQRSKTPSPDTLQVSSPLPTENSRHLNIPSQCTFRARDRASRAELPTPVRTTSYASIFVSCVYISYTHHKKPLKIYKAPSFCCCEKGVFFIFF